MLHNYYQQIILKWNDYGQIVGECDSTNNYQTEIVINKSHVIFNKAQWNTYQQISNSYEHFSSVW